MVPGSKYPSEERGDPVINNSGSRHLCLAFSFVFTRGLRDQSAFPLLAGMPHEVSLSSALIRESQGGSELCCIFVKMSR